MPEYAHMFFCLAAFVTGACVGSFLNVVIARLPEGRSVVSPSSSCPHCGHGIRFYDNIPILSYFILLGRCRDCREWISIRYPFIELITALLFAGLFLKFGLSWALPLFAVFTSAMMAIFWIDLDHMIIPDVISLNLLPLGLAASIAGLIPDIDWRDSVLGMIVGAGALYIPAVLYERVRGVEGLGGGDVKLMALIGSFTGPIGVIFVLFFSSMTGSAAGIVGMLRRKADSTTPIPFGPFITVAAVVWVFLGEYIVRRFAELSRLM